VTESHAYAFGRVRALEVGLIDATQMKRMLDARTADDALKIISETPYGAYLPENPQIPDIEKAIIEELKKTYELSRKISPQREITDLFEVKYDMHNVKILLRSEITERSLSHLLIPLGREGPENIKAALNGDLKAVSPEMQHVLSRARALYEETEDFQKVQFFLDKERSRILRTGFEGSPFLEEFYAIKVDLENIRNFLRAQKFNLDFEDVFLPGGNLDLKFFGEAKEAAEYFIEKTRSKDYAFVVSQGLADYEEEKSLVSYEKLTEDFLMQHMKKAKYYSLSIEPLAGYLFAKEREARIVRQILISKMKGIDVTDRVSEVYE
jgi:V/A-type H+-transporting ATPase subunit C